MRTTPQVEYFAEPLAPKIPDIISEGDTVPVETFGHEVSEEQKLTEQIKNNLSSLNAEELKIIMSKIKDKSK